MNEKMRRQGREYMKSSLELCLYIDIRAVYTPHSYDFSGKSLRRGVYTHER